MYINVAPKAIVDKNTKTAVKNFSVNQFSTSELDKYKILAPIGADSLKYVAGMTGIQKYNGVFLEKRYLPIMHPNITIIKPQLQDDIKRAFLPLQFQFCFTYKSFLCCWVKIVIS